MTAMGTSSTRWSDKPLPIPIPSSTNSLADVGATSARSLPTAHTPGMREWFFGEGKKVVKRLHKEYGGGRGFNGQYSFQRPQKQLNEDLEKDILFAGTAQPTPDGRYTYLNSIGQKVYKLQDVDTYLSPTTYEPRRLMVQAAPHVFNDPFLINTDWRRRRVSGDVPTVLRMAEWALKPGDRNPDTGKRSIVGAWSRIWRVLVVGIPLQILLAFPGAGSPWEEDVEENFVDYPGYHWSWPKHAVNPLDQRPNGGAKKPLSKPVKVSSQSRLMRPRRLMVYHGEERWMREENPDPGLPFVLISYTTGHFNTATEEGKRHIERMAAHVTLLMGCSAFWIDYLCISQSPPQEKTADINRICDVIRSARKTILMMPDQRHKENPKAVEVLLQEWGKRMWTLPEGLLANGDLDYCYITEQGNYEIAKLPKMELTDRVWKDEPSEAGDPPTRILAEHYSATVSLSRLELFSTALAALCDREPTNLYSDADLAYCLMGLMHYRIEPDATDSLFQALARLSLSNDSDRLIERMICMYQKPHHNFRRLFEFLTQKDQYETHLWDVQPLCEVVGVGDEPNTVLINNCKAIPIRWKQFPRIKYSRHYGIKKLLSELFVRSGAWWFIGGVSLAWTYAPFLLANTNDSSRTSGLLSFYLIALILAFIAMGFILSAFGPHAVRRLFGGAVLQTSPHLIGFEGVMPIRDLERLIFGNCSNRMSYEPSSTPFILDHRHPERREGLEPPWVRRNPSRPDIPIPPGQRLFTLVDTNSLSVSIFTAQRPPTVALICGREGGMLRTILCSWRFSMDCLFREAVVRLPSDTWDIAKMPSWLKLSLGNQEDMLDGIRWQRDKLWEKHTSAGTQLSSKSPHAAPSPRSKIVSYQNPPAQVHQSPRGPSQPQQQRRPPQSITPPVSSFSPQASGRPRISGQRQSSVPLPRPSPLKTSTSISAAVAAASSPNQNSSSVPIIQSPQPKPLQHAATMPARSTAYASEDYSPEHPRSPEGSKFSTPPTHPLPAAPLPRSYHPYRSALWSSQSCALRARTSSSLTEPTRRQSSRAHTGLRFAPQPRRFRHQPDWDHPQRHPSVSTSAPTRTHARRLLAVGPTCIAVRVDEERFFA